LPTYTSFPKGSQARESTRFWKIEVQVGTKLNRPLDRANACESARRGWFNRTVVMTRLSSSSRDRHKKNPRTSTASFTSVTATSLLKCRPLSTASCSGASWQGCSHLLICVRETGRRSEMGITGCGIWRLPLLAGSVSTKSSQGADFRCASTVVQSQLTANYG